MSAVLKQRYSVLCVREQAILARGPGYQEEEWKLGNSIILE